MTAIEIIILGYILLATVVVEYLVRALRRLDVPRSVYLILCMLLGLLGLMSAVAFLVLTNPPPFSTQIWVSVMFFWISGFLASRFGKRFRN